MEDELDPAITYSMLIARAAHFKFNRQTASEAASMLREAVNFNPSPNVRKNLFHVIVGQSRNLILYCCKNLPAFQPFITQFPFLLADHLPEEVFFLDEEIDAKDFNPANFVDPNGDIEMFRFWMDNQYTKFII